MEDRGAHLAPLHAMLAMLSRDQKEILARRLNDQLFAPASAGERRIAELGFLAWLLDESPQPPEQLPTIERQAYEARRRVECPTAPRAAMLVDRYGSWLRACWAAWGLLTDGRNAMGGWPWPRGQARRYSAKTCTDAVRACADALGRVPTSQDYQQWARARRRAARDRGRSSEVPSINVVLRILAPDRQDRNGWRLVTTRVFGKEHTRPE